MVCSLRDPMVYRDIYIYIYLYIYIYICSENVLLTEMTIKKTLTIFLRNSLHHERLHVIYFWGHECPPQKVDVFEMQILEISSSKNYECYLFWLECKMSPLWPPISMIMESTLARLMPRNCNTGTLCLVPKVLTLNWLGEGGTSCFCAFWFGVLQTNGVNSYCGLWGEFFGEFFLSTSRAEEASRFTPKSREASTCF